MARFATCQWAPADARGLAPPMRSHAGLVIHQRSGTGPDGLIWYCNPVVGVYATFFVPRSSPPRQLVDDDRQAPLLAAGASSYASAELAGPGGPTPQQLASLAAIYAEGHRLHGWPLALAEQPGEAGLMLHSAGGLRFGAHPLCPGPVGDLRGTVLEHAAAMLARADKADPVSTGNRAVFAAVAVAPTAAAQAAPAPASPAQAAPAPAAAAPVTPVPAAEAEQLADAQQLTGTGEALGAEQATGAVRTIGAGILGSIGLAPPTWTTNVSPGTAAQSPVTIDAAQLQASVISALSAPYADPGATPPAEVTWFDHDGEVMVNLAATTITLLDGLVLAALELSSDQTGTGQVIVPLGVGTPANPTGMLVGTENRPRGLLQLVDRWGDAATAAAWSALLDVAQTLAQQAGADANGAPFIPASVTASTTAFAVLPQARQAMDSIGAS